MRMGVKFMSREVKSLDRNANIVTVKPMNVHSDRLLRVSLKKLFRVTGVCWGHIDEHFMKVSRMLGRRRPPSLGGQWMSSSWTDRFSGSMFGMFLGTWARHRCGRAHHTCDDSSDLHHPFVVDIHAPETTATTKNQQPTTDNGQPTTGHQAASTKQQAASSKHKAASSKQRQQQ